ncbi:nucleotidyltransferase domain-containing protein [Archaeoglobus veneficus]|uniref:DNA polymerase beta domain protein region n=1 Tax=Archaeoglobus veneficus (strain DSM 11195 / SNP6) TaxID=693661 RepID=F2KRV5_ARCVS|nr:nucleotidyltransferase domain-containing protein [Archaeoglobus veneficus]AEA47969.1 DNA polymerase beta domain protein region [Archaeoglobus veneficus SNP6]
MRLSLDQIKKDLQPLSKYEVVIFGSYVTGEFRKGSDIDVAVITRIRDEKQNFAILKKLIGKVKPVYDIRIFELLPLKVKASIIEDYIVVFGDELEISEYFYFWRKFWEDIKHRISYHDNYKEKLEAIERGRRITRRLKSLEP